MEASTAALPRIDLIGSGKGVRPDDEDDPTEGVSRVSARTRDRRRSIRAIVVPDSLVVRARSIVALARRRPSARRRARRVLATSCGDDGPGDTAALLHRGAGRTRPSSTTRRRRADDIDGFLDLYRDIDDVAPLAIEAHWQALVLNYETASTVDMADPESVQRALAQAYATERSAVAVKTFLLANCNVDIGPIATVVPQVAATAARHDRRRLRRRRADGQTGAISPRRLLTSSHRPYSTACSAVNQRSRSESAWICSSVLPEWWAISSAIRRLV